MQMPDTHENKSIFLFKMRHCNSIVNVYVVHLHLHLHFHHLMLALQVFVSVQVKVWRWWESWQWIQ